MIKKIILTENQFSNLLTEELGISSMVTEKAIEVYNIIENEIPKKDNIKIFDNYTYSQFTIKFQLFNFNINCTVNCYNFFTKEYYEYSNIESSAWSVYLGRQMALMGIIVPCISGQMIKPIVIDGLQHEIEHLYQQVMMKKIFSDTSKYALVKNNLQSQDEVERKTAKLVYGCIKSEQDGFVKGLYGYLMALPGVFSMESLKQTPTWELYVDIINDFNELSDLPDFSKNLKKYGLTKNKIVKALNNFIKKIGKVVLNVKQDKYQKQGYRD